MWVSTIGVIKSIDMNSEVSLVVAAQKTITQCSKNGFNKQISLEQQVWFAHGNVAEKLKLQVVNGIKIFITGKCGNSLTIEDFFIAKHSD
jgi:hypothetical protein